MLTLNDGRTELWQWDTGRTLSVDADCSQVHFSNKVFGRSIDVDVVDGSAIIPDILLQTDKDLNVWAFVGTAENGYTKISKTFKVNRRNKPADYVFTPTDQTTLAELSGRLDRIEESQDPDAIKNAVEDYLAQNPVEVPVQSVNGQTGAVELNAENVGAISETELPTAINTALAQAKASGEFDGADGAPGKDGANGVDGITPSIGDNGNWYLGATDTGKPSRGEKGDTGEKGEKGDTGATGPAGPAGPAGAPGPTYTAGENITISADNVISATGGSGGQVQPDWNQNDSTASDYVKNRPFYTGAPVETVLVEENTVSFVASNGMYMGQLESTFSPTVGKTYKVSWDGTVYESSCVDNGGVYVIGNLSIMGLGSDNGEPFLMVLNGIRMAIFTKDTSTSHTFSISGMVATVVKIDDKYLPDNLVTNVAEAKDTANNAQETANNAQVSANNAQVSANSNKEVLYSAFGSTVTFTFDKQTSGRATFVFNDFNYYKISDFNPAPEAVTSFKGTRENGLDYSTINAGNNCVKYGLFIVVSSAGGCSIPISETVTGSFTAPSAGLYAQYEENNAVVTAGTGQFTLMSIDGLTIKSSTANSTKKFRITVDDSGTLKATEVT